MNLDHVSQTQPCRAKATAASPVIEQPTSNRTKAKSNATQVDATDTCTTSSAAIRRQFQLPVRVGGWSGIHDYLVLPQLADRAKAAGVKIKLEVADEHWWKGTLYNVNVEGATENVERFIALTLRDPYILP